MDNQFTKRLDDKSIQITDQIHRRIMGIKDEMSSTRNCKVKEAKEKFTETIGGV